VIELAEGVWIAPEHVTMVKAAGDDKCQIYFVGQSALEGFTLPYAASEVAEAIDDSFCDDGDDDVEDDTEDE
jgi:competence transcription factor ComK